MNREKLLCRAKRLDNGKWIEGYYVRMPVVDVNDLIEIGDPMPDTAADCITIVKVKRYQDRVSGQRLATAVQETHRVDPETVCRYTGLKDSHGKRVFEWDFITCTRYIGGLRKYALTKWGLVLERHGAFGILQNYVRLESWQVPYTFRPFKGWLEDYEYEVTGNKYDNPTLWGRFTRAGGPGLRYE